MIDLHNEIAIADQRIYLGVRVDLFVHFGAVDAAALFDDDQQALALGFGLGQIFAQILEGFAQPCRFVQPVIAKGRGGGDKRHKAQGKRCKSAGKHRWPPYFSVADQLKFSISQFDRIDTELVAIRMANTKSITPMTFST